MNLSATNDFYPNISVECDIISILNMDHLTKERKKIEFLSSSGSSEFLRIIELLVPMMKISWVQKIPNEEVLMRTITRKILWRQISSRIRLTIWLRTTACITEGYTEGRNSIGRSRLEWTSKQSEMSTEGVTERWRTWRRKTEASGELLWTDRYSVEPVDYKLLALPSPV